MAMASEVCLSTALASAQDIRDESIHAWDPNNGMVSRAEWIKASRGGTIDTVG